jgi:hypothetical protein
VRRNRNGKIYPAKLKCASLPRKRRGRLSHFSSELGLLFSEFRGNSTRIRDFLKEVFIFCSIIVGPQLNSFDYNISKAERSQLSPTAFPASVRRPFFLSKYCASPQPVC